MLLRIPRLTRNATLAFLAVNLLLGAAWAQKETVLYSFCSQNECTDGAGPYGGLVFDKKGNLYGTAIGGGDYGYGAVFKVAPSGNETKLYSFSGSPDGASPYAGLVFDTKGNLYGTTYYGGPSTHGTVFKVAPSGGETVLYSFTGGTDGAYPYAGLVLDKKGNLYGTAQQGGGNNLGTVFKVTPSGKEKVLHSFTRGSDGGNPYAGLIFDKKWNLYGTTEQGGGNSEGTVFKVTPSGKETVLYSFCSETKCVDGQEPYAGLVFDKKWNLYGTTEQGGGNRNGTVFKVAPSGQETTLYNFCSQSGCTDGAYPFAGLVFDKKGNLYGTTEEGGNGYGTVFKLVP
jgi:uncharacterized repeat protein (TIGR03803 family)